MDRQLPPPDRFSVVRPACWAALGATAILIVVASDVTRAFSDHASFSDFLVLAPFFLFALFGLTLDWLGALAVNAWRRQWRRLASALVAPAFLLAAPAAFMWSGVSPRFLIERPRLQRAVDAIPPGGRYVEFFWDESGFVGASNTRETMIFDETDTLPGNIKSGKTKWPPSWTTVRPMGGHFFFVSEDLDWN